MKIIPKYSYEFNQVLNPQLNETDQIKNFASLLSDKDRFLIFLPELEKNSKLIEEKLGFKLKEEVECYVIRAEKLKSFSEPISIEYSILPEEMFLFLIKEICKVSITTRFPEELTREQFINSFIDYIAINGDFSTDFVKFTKNLHDYSKELYPSYEYKELNFSSANLKDLLDKHYDENPINFN